MARFEMLVQGRIGADLALAQASLAALVLGQPFVAAEVVFIALLGEVLEAWTFRARTSRDGPAGRADAADRAGAPRRPGSRDPGAPGRGRRSGDRAARRACSGRRHAWSPADSTVDQSALSGESLPIDKGPGDPVFTGTMNQFGVIEVDTEKVGELTRPSARWSSWLPRPAGERPTWRNWPTAWRVISCRWSRWSRSRRSLLGYLAGWPDVWSRVVAVLVVACPCGLVLATPAAMLASMAWLARHGVLIKGGSAVESLATCDTFAFDKTGTLTKGLPQFTRLVVTGSRSDDEVLRLAASAEAVEPPSAGSGRDRRGPAPVVAARRRFTTRSCFPARASGPSASRQRRDREPSRSWSATGGCSRNPGSRSIRPPTRCWTTLTRAARPR